MISVEHLCGQITVKGHADYAPKGYDIVCEAVSALTQTYVCSLEHLTDDKVRYSLSPGYACIADPRSPEGYLLTQSFLIGLDLLAHTYPDYVKIKHLGLYMNEPETEDPETSDTKNQT